MESPTHSQDPLDAFDYQTHEQAKAPGFDDQSHPSPPSTQVKPQSQTPPQSNPHLTLDMPTATDTSPSTSPSTDTTQSTGRPQRSRRAPVKFGFEPSLPQSGANSLTTPPTSPEGKVQAKKSKSQKSGAAAAAGKKSIPKKAIKGKDVKGKRKAKPISANSDSKSDDDQTTSSDTESDGDDDDDNILAVFTASTSTASGTEKTTKNTSVKKGKRSAKAAALDEVEESHMVAPPIRNLGLLPPEIRFHVFSYIVPSKLVLAMLVCKAWYVFIAQSEIWVKIARTANLGEPKRKYKSYLALVLANHYFICDCCHKGYFGRRTRESDIPLAVHLDGDPEGCNVLMCLPCRQAHYEAHPEPAIEAGERLKLTKSAIATQYALWNDDLDGLDFYTIENFLYRNAFPMYQYDTVQVHERARELHGGEVGITGATRHVSTRMRKLAQGPPKPKKPRKINPDREAQMVKAEEDAVENIQRWVSQESVSYESVKEWAEGRGIPLRRVKEEDVERLARKEREHYQRRHHRYYPSQHHYH